MRGTFETMGTVASVTVSDPTVLPDLVALFESVEARFSLYRPDSELSRIADGRLRLQDASAELRATYARAIDWRILTDGLFTPTRPDGVLDLNGIVKAEAIETAGRLLDDAGYRDWSLNVGGDILVSAGEPSTVGIEDPEDSAALLSTIELGGRRRALATSGSAQRGDHIWLGGSTTPADFVQVSVVADDIVTADVLATAIVAGGTRALDQITDAWDVDVLTVDRDGALLATPGLTEQPARL